MDVYSPSRGLRIGRSTRKHQPLNVKGARVSPTMVPRAPSTDHDPPLHEVVNREPRRRYGSLPVNEKLTSLRFPAYNS